MSGATTPMIFGHKAGSGKAKSTKAITTTTMSPKKSVLVCNEYIEPDDLVPAFVSTKTKLFRIQRPRQDKAKPSSKLPTADGVAIEPDDLEEQKLLARLERIVQDVLFDKDIGEQRWRAERLALEKEYAITKKKLMEDAEDARRQEKAEVDSTDSDDDIAREAKKMAAEILEQDDSDDDQALSDLFANLPVQEIDEKTGETKNVINGADGVKVYIQDFGKWTGFSPVQALKETCRSRYAITIVKSNQHVLTTV